MDNEVQKIIKEVTEQLPMGHADAYSDAFMKEQQNVSSPNQSESLKIVRLLQGVFSMYQTEDPKRPFGPFFEMGNKRGMVPDDLTEIELNLLAEVAVLGGPPAFQARIADVLWIRKSKPQYARQAIQGYLNYFDAFTEGHWPLARDYAKRAARLALSLGKSAKEIATVRDKIWSRFITAATQTYTDHMCNWPIGLAKVLVEEFKDLDWEELGKQCSKYAEGLTDAFIHAECLKLSARAFQLAGNVAARNATYEAIGDLWVSDAARFENSEGGEGMQMAFRFENAIAAFREAGAKEKAERSLKLLQTANRRSIQQMHPISVRLDLAPFLKKAHEQMTKKTGKEALDSFIGLHSPQSYAGSRGHAEKQAAAPRLQNLFASTVLVEEGNIAAKSDGGLHSSPDKVMQELAQNYGIARNLGAAVLIEGLTLMMQDPERHWEAAVHELVTQSSFVPDGRSEFFSRALIGCLEGDGALFLHLVIPQLENAIRCQVDGVGGKTTALRDGVMREVDLNGMLVDSGSTEKTAVGALGEDLAWEFRMLLIDQHGPNMRNRIAHGLSSVDDCSSPNVIFLCWLTLFTLTKFKTVTSPSNETQPSS